MTTLGFFTATAAAVLVSAGVGYLVGGLAQAWLCATATIFGLLVGIVVSV